MQSELSLHSRNNLSLLVSHQKIVIFSAFFNIAALVLDLINGSLTINNSLSEYLCSLEKLSLDSFGFSQFKSLLFSLSLRSFCLLSDDLLCLGHFDEERVLH